MTRFFFIAVLLLSSVATHAQTEPIVLRIFFDGGSYYMRYEHLLEIDQAINSIADVNQYQITIYSHTDNIGGKRYNEWLSMMRSHSVVQQLVTKNIAEELIIVKDFGEEDPLYSNANYGGAVGNRRVDLIFWPVVL